MDIIYQNYITYTYRISGLFCMVKLSVREFQKVNIRLSILKIILVINNAMGFLV